MSLENCLAKNLKALRLVRRMSQVEFAQEIGISKSTLQEIESGKSPNLDTLTCIAARLNIPLSVLISGTAPSDQMGLLVELIRTFDWFAQLSPALQEELLETTLQISRALSILKENSGEVKPCAATKY